MNKLTKTLLLILTVSFFTSCDFINNAFTYKDTTKGFVEALIEEDYEKSVSFMAIENEAYKNTNIDTLKLGLVNFRKIIVDNFGKELDYKFMTANKTFSTVEGESTAPNTTLAQIEFSNETEFGIFEITFADNTNKILHIKTLDLKEKIPNMIWFWLFGILAICIPIFNIWIIRKIKKSNLKKKWLKYIAVIFLNVPAITYSAVYGLSFNLLSFQILFGISFSYMGYLSSAWTFGIPLGGLYWLWKLNKKTEDETTEKELITE
jgi:limonene-1,2-epoxide hydrolase